jgi:CBS domain containing-hemolysin-like protein
VIKGVSFFSAFFLISYLHIVVGELAPKSWAIRKPELLSLWTAVPLYLFYWAMYPAIYLLNAQRQCHPADRRARRTRPAP